MASFSACASNDGPSNGVPFETLLSLPRNAWISGGCVAKLVAIFIARTP